MDRVQAVVAIELLDRVFAGVAVATVHLNRQAVGFQTELRRPGFDDRCEQVEQTSGLFARCGIRCVLLLVNQGRGEQAQRQTTLNEGFLRQQQTTNVGVLHQRDHWGCRITLGQTTPLGTLAGVFQRVQVAGVAQHDRT